MPKRKGSWVTVGEPKKKEIPAEIREKMAKSPYINWSPTLENTVCVPDNKILLFKFEEIFTEHPELKVYDKFSIKKGSYETQLDNIAYYINFFIDLYDDEKELPTIYLNMKYIIDRQRIYNEETIKDFKDYVMHVMFTDSMKDKISRCVEDSYVDDIETGRSTGAYKETKQHLESLEFTNEHVRVILKIALSIKFLAPVILHFFSMNNIKLDKDTRLFMLFYDELLTMYSDTVNIYNKLFVYTKTKVVESKSHNNLMFEQQEIFGIDQYTLTHSFLMKVVLSENFVKINFSKKWNYNENKFAENIPGFIKTIIKYQLYYFRKREFTQKPTEVTGIKNQEGLSGQDKMEMNQSKLDESLIIFNDQNLTWGIKYLDQNIDIEISTEEIDYYMSHWEITPMQANLIRNYYSSTFGSVRELLGATRREFVKISLLMKKLMILDSCTSKTKPGSSSSSVLPYILTGNQEEKGSARLVRNAKFITRVKDSYLYNDLLNSKYSYYAELKPDCIMDAISPIINSNFTYVTFENQELTGKLIEYDEDKLADEILLFIYNI